jgi:hypothetical protein
LTLAVIDDAQGCLLAATGTFFDSTEEVRSGGGILRSSGMIHDYSWRNRMEARSS